MSWGIGVSTQIAGVGIAQVGWRFSTQVNYTWVQPGFLCVVEDYIPDNVSVYLTLRFESGYTIDFWEISRDGGSAETETIASIRVRSEGASFVYVYAHAKAAPPPPTYTISATVNFDAQGGQVSPSSRTGYAYDQPSQDGYVSIDFPVPTRQGYTFLYWLLDGIHVSAGVNSVYATSGGTTYIARAQWQAGRITGIAVDTGGEWVNAVPYIDTGNGWKECVSQLDHNGSWESA